MTTPPNITQTILRETAPLAEKTALVDGPRSLSYGQLAAAVGRLADELADAGVRPLDRVAFLCPDSADYVLLSLAVLSLDAAIVPIAPGLMSDECSALLEKMDVHHLLAAAPEPRTATGHSLRNTSDLTRPFTLSPRPPRRPPPEGYADIRPAFIRFSSGTTGASKGVVLSHATILERTDAANRGLHVTSEDIIGWVLSMSFHFVVTILLFLRKGATLVLCGDPMPDALVDAVQRHPLTLLYASPIHYRLLSITKMLSPAHFSSVRTAVSTAIKLPEAVAQNFYARFGLRLTEAYGIIEVGLPFIHQPRDLGYDGLLGQALPDYTVKLDANGEVLIRGKGLFDAYFAPWQTRASCHPDGWFHTGDLGELSEDGNLRLVGRCKSVINFSGMKIFPQEVEELLNQYPGIAESFVYGEPHPEYGQLPCAKVVLKAGATTLNESDLRAFCRTRLALHKIPKVFTCVPAIEKTATGKIRRA